MKSISIIGLFMLISFSALSQNQFDIIDKKMDAMPESYESSTSEIATYIKSNFTTEDDKARAAFYWTASTISYDVENMLNQPPNQTPEDKISKTLKSKKGVCMHYAQIFYDLMEKLNIKTVLISGYTRDKKGKVATLSHVWCASKLEDKWFLFDPTWGSGYVNDTKFIKKLDNKYYKAEPKSLISSHMPFDYLWQFSNFPMNNQEFYEGKIEATNKTSSYDYLKEIDNLENLSDIDKSKNTIERIQKSGLKNRLITERLEFEKKKLSSLDQKVSFVKLDEIVDNYNECNRMYGEFIKYKNNKFIPLVSDEDLKSKIQLPYDLLLKSISDINELKDIKRENLPVINNLKKDDDEI